MFVYGNFLDKNSWKFKSKKLGVKLLTDRVAIRKHK